MMVVIGSTDRFLGDKLAQLGRAAGLRPIRSASLERITGELKKPDCVVVLDMGWVALQAPGVLRQLVNLGKITGGRVVCICPNTAEPIKKLVKESGCSAWFLRYDLGTEVKAYLQDLLLVKQRA